MRVITKAEGEILDSLVIVIKSAIEYIEYGHKNAFRRYRIVSQSLSS